MKIPSLAAGQIKEKSTGLAFGNGPVRAVLFIGITVAVALVRISPASAVIFGNDDRKNAVQASAARDTHRSVALALLTGVQTWQKAADGSALLDLDTESLNVCKDVKFASDPVVLYPCTGFLVAPDLLATAGHCQVNVGVSQNETESYCKAYDWLFDYEADASGQVKTKGISPEKLYHCKKIIYAVNDEHAPYNDFALVQLDRPVVDRKPLKLASAPSHVGDSVSILGFPLGTPMKFADQAHIRANASDSPTYTTDLDVMDGDSGAPVMNQLNEVIGILISGEPAELFYTDPAQGCQRYNSCDQNGLNCKTPSVIKTSIPIFQKPGSDVFRIAPLKELLERTLANQPPRTPVK